MSETPLYHARATCCWCGGKLRAAMYGGVQAWFCERDACLARQLAHAVLVTQGETRRALFVPLPKQAWFYELVRQYRRVLYGGAAGGAKSHSLRWLLYSLCLQHPGFRALLLRRTFPELEDTHLDRALIEAETFGADALKAERKIRFPNGSVLQMGHCQDDEAVARYLSTEYDCIAFDELVTFTEKQFLMIASRARSSKAGIRPMVVAGTNPGGQGSRWVRDRFIDHTVDRMAHPDYRAEEYYYLPATLDENPYLDDEYERNLADLPEDLREAYRWGNWDIFPGQYFKEWRAQKGGKAYHVKELTVDSELPRIGALDWGYVKPGWYGEFVMLPDGHAYLDFEWVFQGQTYSEVAREIRRHRREAGVRVRYTVADTQLWAPDSDSGEEGQETFAKNGVPLVQADKGRIPGWIRFRHWLREAPDKMPWLVVSPDCPYFCRTIPALISDSHKPEDVDTDGEDHAADAARYFFMSRPVPLSKRVVTHYPKGTGGAMLAELSRPKVAVVGQYAVRGA